MFILDGACNEYHVLNAISIIFKIISIVKIVIPLFIIVLGMIDFTKALTSSDEKAIQKSILVLLRRVIAGVVIFFVPTIITAFLSLMNTALNINISLLVYKDKVDNLESYKTDCDTEKNSNKSNVDSKISNGINNKNIISSDTNSNENTDNNNNNSSNRSNSNNNDTSSNTQDSSCTYGIWSNYLCQSQNKTSTDRIDWECTYDISSCSDIKPYLCRSRSKSCN